MNLNLKMVPGDYAIARLAHDAKIPEWADGPGFVAIARADDEMTVVCLESRIPQDVQADKGWACLRTLGPFDFAATGIVKALIAPLSENGIGVFVVCTFDGEHLLVATGDLPRSRALLCDAGHRFAP